MAEQGTSELAALFFLGSPAQVYMFLQVVPRKSGVLEPQVMRARAAIVGPHYFLLQIAVRYDTVRVRISCYITCNITGQSNLKRNYNLFTLRRPRRMGIPTRGRTHIQFSECSARTTGRLTKSSMERIIRIFPCAGVN